MHISIIKYDKEHCVQYRVVLQSDGNFSAKNKRRDAYEKHKFT